MQIREISHHTRNAMLALAAVLSLSLVACGGGGSASSPAAVKAHSAALTSGTVRAFGSVFVDGHEFDSSGATVVDDDTGATVPGTAAGSALAVGMNVDVKPSASSTDAAPSAQEIRVIALARGPVDASDSTASQLSVMGQIVQLTAASAFKDARSCAQGTSPTCTAITDQSGLTANCSHSGTAAYACTSGSGTSVQVFGYVNASANTLTASLVRVIDNTASIFKATGSLTIASTGAAPASYTINRLGFASGTACGSPIDCNFTGGEVVTTRGTTAPTTGAPGSTLPIPVTFTPVTLHLSHASMLTVGNTVELEGIVSNAMGSTYMVEGITVTAGAGQTLPADGDTIEVTGTVTSAAPPAITASSESAEDGADHRKGGGFLLDDTLAAHAVMATTPATTPPTYAVSLLGISVQVNSLTHIEDETATTATAFNINNFQSYIDAYVATGGATGVPHVTARGYIDKSSGSEVLVALDFRITSAPAGTAGFNARIGGVITATTMSGFSVAGVTVPFTGTAHDPSGTVVTLQQGDYVGVRLMDSGGTFSVTSVVDYGVKMDHGG